ncbi:MAG: gas vesicle protein, partial [Terriglobales bacterium]
VKSWCRQALVLVRSWEREFPREKAAQTAMERIPTVSGTTNLIDILDRVLDKGLVIAGDVRVSLANVELLTIRIRLLVCSVDKAEQIGLNWWKFDPNLTQQAVPAPRTRRPLPPQAEILAPPAPAKRARSGRRKK